MRTFAYDLVLLDNHLSGNESSHDGLDILCSIRSRSRTSRVILTAWNGSPMLATAARELGAAGYLEKPVPLATILKEMERCGVACSGFEGGCSSDAHGSGEEHCPSDLPVLPVM